MVVQRSDIAAQAVRQVEMMSDSARSDEYARLAEALRRMRENSPGRWFMEKLVAKYPPDAVDRSPVGSPEKRVRDGILAFVCASIFLDQAKLPMDMRLTRLLQDEERDPLFAATCLELKKNYDQDRSGFSSAAAAPAPSSFWGRIKAIATGRNPQDIVQALVVQLDPLVAKEMKIEFTPQPSPANVGGSIGFAR